MSPPVAIIVVSVVAGVAVCYAVKEAWEPHIKPELQKASAKAKTWWTRSAQHATSPVRFRFMRRRRSSEVITTDLPADDASVLERKIDDVLLGQSTKENEIRHRSRSSLKSSNSGEVEMMELDKSNPFVPQVPIRPQGSSVASPRISQPANPLADPQLAAGKSRTPSAYGLNTPPASAASMSSGHPADSLLLSFHAPMEREHLPPLSPNFALNPPHLPPTFSSSNISGYEQSPWSEASALDSAHLSTSSFMWTDGEDNASRPASGLSGQFDAEDAEFSLGSLDGLSED
ncbi:hypothetical protein BS47DRAFT_1390446 [Hydnum rufescens UP504]|uniref:Uncharacterized protein n=1 Tax=Hydnum rufescens UP504 TaxID=1448309 RepID=A0A9P6DZL8_9AGAM|nr:hypothetical protein BS47DRAFT_1390446 [Hydnum rufescens UP504]